MIAEMYKRREKLGYAFLGFIILIIVGWSPFQTPETTEKRLEMLFFLMPIGLIVSIILVSRLVQQGKRRSDSKFRAAAIEFESCGHKKGCSVNS